MFLTVQVVSSVKYEVCGVIWSQVKSVLMENIHWGEFPFSWDWN